MITIMIMNDMNELWIGVFGLFINAANVVE